PAHLRRRRRPADPRHRCARGGHRGRRSEGHDRWTDRRRPDQGRAGSGAGLLGARGGRRAVRRARIAHPLPQRLVVDDPMSGAQMAADRLASLPPTAVVHADLSVEDLMASPHVLVGSVDHIADTLRERRERYGISYVSVMAPFLDTFGPVVARL